MDFLMLLDDSTAALALSRRKVHGRQRRVTARFPWPRDAMRKMRVKVKKVHAKSNVVDPLAKSTPSQIVQMRVKPRVTPFEERGQDCIGK